MFRDFVRVQGFCNGSTITRAEGVKFEVFGLLFKVQDLKWGLRLEALSLGCRV